MIGFAEHWKGRHDIHCSMSWRWERYHTLQDSIICTCKERNPLDERVNPSSMVSREISFREPFTKRKQKALAVKNRSTHKSCRE
jgi:hypothetical protein